MNEIVNKFLLAGYTFMPEFKETGDTSYIYKNELDKACFQQDMAYGDFKDLERRTASDKVLRDLKLLKILNMMDIKEDLLL